MLNMCKNYMQKGKNSVSPIIQLQQSSVMWVYTDC